MGGVGFQECFILVFAYIAFRFHRQIKRERPERLSQALLLLYAQVAVLILITVGAPTTALQPTILHLLNKPQVRIVFRLIEWSGGLNSTIPNHEVYQYIFDSLPMFTALVIYNVIHPGRIMPGKKSDFPSRKERKNYFKRASSGNSFQLLPTTQPVEPVSMPEEGENWPKRQDAIPSTGYVR